MKKAQGPKSSLPTPEGLGLSLVSVGEIVGTFGLKGWVKVKPLTDFAERFERGCYLVLGNNRLEIKDVGWKELQVRLKLEGVDTIDQAEALVGQKLLAPRGDHPPLEEDQYYSADLIGIQVELEDGTKLGKLDEVMVSPAHDIFRVGTILIPAVKEFVKLVSLKEDRIVVRLIPGMLPEEKEED